LWLKCIPPSYAANGRRPASHSWRGPALCSPALVGVVAPVLTSLPSALASSEELRADRDEFDLYFRQQNDFLLQRGLYLQIIRWENFLDAMSETRLQDEYNKEVRAADIFVSLFMTKTGKYTEEEFDVANQAFHTMGKPRIF